MWSISHLKGYYETNITYFFSWLIQVQIHTYFQILINLVPVKFVLPIYVLNSINYKTPRKKDIFDIIQMDKKMVKYWSLIYFSTFVCVFCLFYTHENFCAVLSFSDFHLTEFITVLCYLYMFLLLVEIIFFYDDKQNYLFCKLKFEFKSFDNYRLSQLIKI